MMGIGESKNRLGEATKTARSAPVIIMGYAGSGADRLLSVLSAFPELARTRQTGILPLCHQAVTTWQMVDALGGEGISPLGAVSVRALYGSLVAAILAHEGGSRWCEFTNAPPAAAGTFARLCPEAQFLIVHRRADLVVKAVIDSARWGPEGPEFAPFVSAHPTSLVAALASYWAAHTAQQLEFEQANPKASHRVHVDDLIQNGAQILPGIGDFLALDGAHVSQSFTRDDEWDSQDGNGDPIAAPGLPLDRIPMPLLMQVNDLHHRLGYSPITATGCDTRRRVAKDRT
jgi:hypothetical protein